MPHPRKVHLVCMLFLLFQHLKLCLVSLIHVPRRFLHKAVWRHTFQNTNSPFQIRVLPKTVQARYIWLWKQYRQGIYDYENSTGKVYMIVKIVKKSWCNRNKMYIMLIFTFSTLLRWVICYYVVTDLKMLFVLLCMLYHTN